MNTNPLFNNQMFQKVVSTKLKLHSKYEKLQEIETYFISECRRRKLFWCYDQFVDERPYFETLTYTTLAGLFIIHPLNIFVRNSQIKEASDDPNDNLDYVNFLINEYNNNPNKYVNSSKFDYTKKIEALVVLPGENKIHNTVDLNRLKKIVEIHKNEVVFKPHPLTYPNTIDTIVNFLQIDHTQFAPPCANLYNLMNKVNYVYTTHNSESVLFAAVFDKNVQHIDIERYVGDSSFGYISTHLFNPDNQDKKDWINKTFSNYKSGVFHPDVDFNWQDKMNNYFEYIIDIRDTMKLESKEHEL